MSNKFNLKNCFKYLIYNLIRLQHLHQILKELKHFRFNFTKYMCELKNNILLFKNYT